jgi:pimeloyl-ACP methyl ester carboxylesterase
MDSSHQGASGVMNEYKMGDDRMMVYPGLDDIGLQRVASWLDGARDNLHMINTFRDQMPRPIVGVGHSMGAAQLYIQLFSILISYDSQILRANLALLHPRLLTTLVLMEPVIQLESPVSSNSTGAAGASTFRRDIWPSRAAAEKTFRNHQFYQRWDPRVLDLWIKYGFRELPTAIYSSSPQGEKPVTLTTTKHQEVFSFARPNFPSTYAGSSVRAVNRITHPDLDPENIEYPTYRYEPASTFLKLPFIRPSVLYIFGEDSIISSPEGRKAKTTTTGTGVGGSGGAQEGRVKDIHLAKIGHLVAMEALGACADAASAWLSTELERWRQEADAFQQEWNKKSLVEKSTTSAEWNSIMTPKVWKEIFPKEKTKKATGSKL